MVLHFVARDSKRGTLSSDEKGEACSAAAAIMARPMGLLCPAVSRTLGPSASLAAVSCSSGITAGDSPASGASFRGEKGRADLHKQRAVQQQHMRISVWSQGVQHCLATAISELDNPHCSIEESNDCP